MPFSFKTLTPIWTGDINRNSASVHMPGIIGSLRWWYEGIVRGLGGDVCAIVSQNSGNGAEPCRIDPKKDRERQIEELCPVCKLFGCTGWQRQFKIDIAGLESIPLFFRASSNVYTMAGNWLWRIYGAQDTGGTKTGKGAGTQFSFGLTSLWGRNVTVQATPLGNDKEEIISKLTLLFSIINEWGTLGAKPQHGFGVVKFSALDQESIKKGIRGVKKDIQQSVAKANTGGCFSICDFFSITYEINSIEKYINDGRTIGKEQDYKKYKDMFIPCAFDIRYKSAARNPFTGIGNDFGMRPWFKKKGFDKQEIDYIFGTVKPKGEHDRSAGKIGVSHLYRDNREQSYRLRIWGYLPQDSSFPGISKERVVRNIKEFIRKMFDNSKIIKTFDLERELSDV